MIRSMRPYSQKRIFCCQAGFEALLEAELRSHGLLPEEKGRGWILAEGNMPSEELCFPHKILELREIVSGQSVNELAERLLRWFLADARQRRFEGEWPCCFEAAPEPEGLGRRVKAVERAFREALKKRMGRVARLAVDRVPPGFSLNEGLYVFFIDFKRACVATRFFFNGQRRMADDPLAPSRSYLKVEEAYQLLGREPLPDETVVDLGAAPGGWSYSAAKRGARVLAVDNGPLKAGAADNERITHRMEDAFDFRPTENRGFDWMFCDLVEEPHHVLDNIVTPWLRNRWCRNFVVILKFGRVDPLALLERLRSPASVLSGLPEGSFKIRHLYHNREEFTIVGSLESGDLSGGGQKQ